MLGEYGRHPREVFVGAFYGEQSVAMCESHRGELTVETLEQVGAVQVKFLTAKSHGHRYNRAGDRSRRGYMLCGFVTA